MMKTEKAMTQSNRLAANNAVRLETSKLVAAFLKDGGKITVAKPRKSAKPRTFNR
jgi:hypothetical protein